MNFAQRPPADQIIDGEPRLVHLRPVPDQPAGPGQRLLTLAANGTQCDPTPVAEILDRDGQPLTNADGEPVVHGRQRAPPRRSRRAWPPR